MPEELLTIPEYEDKDLTLRIVQQTVAAIMQEVTSIDDIFNDRKKARLFASVDTLLQDLGMTLNQVFPAEIVDAYAAGHEMGGTFLENLGAEEIKGDLTSRVHTEAVQAVAVNGVTDMQAAIRTAGLMFINDIGAILEDVQTNIGQGVASGMSTKEITKRVQAEFMKNGMTGFITKNGRRLPLDFYAMTVTRTKVREAHTQGAAKRYEENGCDLVRFPVRGGTCSVCGAREKVVISLNGETEGYPTAADIGGLPPWHPNCRHYPIPVLDFQRSQYPPKRFTGRDMRTDKSKELYDNEQAIRRKANEEKKQYLRMKAEADAAGESFPSIGTWRRMKRKNDQKWKDLQGKYKASVSKLPTTRKRVRDTPRNEELVGAAQSKIRTILQGHANTPAPAPEPEIPVRPARRITSPRPINPNYPNRMQNLTQRPVQEVENEIRSLPYERGFVYSPEGDLLWEQTGQAASVDLSDALQRELLQGSIVTHNHPSSSSFSPADIGMLVKNRLSEIRAASNEYDYSMKLDMMKMRGNWREIEPQINEAVTRLNREVRRELTALVDRGTITPEEASLQHWHLIWTKFIEEGNDYLVYERRRPNS